MIDTSRFPAPEFVGDLVWVRNALGVEIDTVGVDKALVVQVADDGYRIAVPFSAIEPVSTVWAVGQQPGSLAVKRSWWDSQTRRNGSGPQPSEAIAEAMALRDSVGPHAPPINIVDNNKAEALRHNGNTTAAEIVLECDRIEKMLLAKNRAYGDSCLAPKSIFSRVEPLEQIKVRIDDKLSRVANGNEDLDEDAVQDLIGYLILYCIGKRRNL